jgi:hypothetical protein
MDYHPDHHQAKTKFNQVLIEFPENFANNEPSLQRFDKIHFQDTKFKLTASS